MAHIYVHKETWRAVAMPFRRCCCVSGRDKILIQRAAPFVSLFMNESGILIRTDDKRTVTRARARTQEGTLRAKLCTLLVLRGLT